MGASIVNGLFAGRSGIATHGAGIATAGDNVANASTIGFKASRAEFQDFIAGGGAAGRTIGSGSALGAVSTIFEQGTLEFTGRPLDMAVDGNGLFVVAKGPQRFYTRAGNFKVDTAGYIVNSDGLAVLGFPSDGNGGLEPINVNSVQQSSVATTALSISGNVDSRKTPILANAAAIPDPTAGATYSDLNAAAAYSTVVDVFDSLGASHSVTFYYFHVQPTGTESNRFIVRGYVNNEDVEAAPATTGQPRQIPNDVTMTFDGSGQRIGPPAAGTPDFTSPIPWANGADAGNVKITMSPFTSYASSNNILSITQDGKGVGAVTNISIDDKGQIFALLSNGQSATIGTVGLVNFSNPEGLTRLGKNLLAQSTASGEPIVGKPQAGTFGSVKSGSLELSTVDIAAEFVKIITLQRGFQASSRIITTINQLLNEIIQLA